jgi:hypothetical protein
VRATFIAAVLVAVLVGGPLAAPALGAPGLVIDAATGEVLVSEEATRPWHPASTTKMMTAFVALRAVKAGRLTIDTPLVASANAARQKPSKVGIRPGQEITLDNALKIMMVRSANDLAVVIAEAVGGSVPGFAQMMNAEARRLGMNETRFSNPHGFHEVGHQTSARDLALLARAMLVEYPEFNEYWGISSVQLGNRVMNNTNGLIGRYPGASGLKTGFVCASGFNLVATANRGGRTLISVVLGAQAASACSDRHSCWIRPSDPGATAGRRSTACRRPVILRPLTCGRKYAPTAGAVSCCRMTPITAAPFWRIRRAVTAWRAARPWRFSPCRASRPRRATTLPARQAAGCWVRAWRPRPSPCSWAAHPAAQRLLLGQGHWGPDR